MKREYEPVEARGRIQYTHVFGYPNRKGVQRCVSCGAVRPVARRKGDLLVLAMTLHKGWRLVATPLRYRVQRLEPCIHSPGGNPVWRDVRVMPRTRRQWVEQEWDCAVQMFEREFMVHKVKKDIDVPPSPEPGILYPSHVATLLGWRRFFYAACIIFPEWTWSGFLWRSRFWGLTKRWTY